MHGAAPAARLRNQRPVFHDKASAHQRMNRQTLHAAAVPWRDAGARLQRCVGDGPFPPQIDDREVGVGARHDRPLARIEPPDFCRRLGGPARVVADRHAPGVDLG